MKIAEKLDDIVMKGVNAGVHAWNWTTGRGKADLANLLNISGGLTINTGFILQRDYLSTSIFLPTMIFVSYKLGRANKSVEKSEINAINSQALDIEVEDNKRVYKFVGYSIGILSAIFLPINIFKPVDLQENPHAYTDKIGSLIVNAGNFMLASSHQVMRADCLPPRKNCISRAADKISEYAAKVKESFAPQPALTPVQVLDYRGKDDNKL